MTESQKAKYRVGVIGVGRQGTHHARAYALHPSTEVVAAADTDAENLALFCERFNITAGYDSYEQMFQKEQIDIAAPVLPVRANADAVVASAEAGVKAVFCEKPLAGSLADADRMVEACQSRGIPFVAGLVARNYPDYWQARDFLESGVLGEVHSINVYDGNGQGGCHGINLARHFAGDAEVDWVVGWVDGDPFSDYQEGHSNGEEGFGGISGYLRFSNGLECFSRIQGTMSRLEVICSRGILSNEGNTWNGLHILKAPDSMARWALTDLQEIKGILPAPFPTERHYDDEGWMYPGHGIMASVQALVETLDTGTRLKCSTGEDLRKALEICIALRESHRQNHAPVKLPLADRSLKMYPVRGRWHYKKEVHGAEWYREAMTQHKKPSGG
jgi:predicted dehydrogenase